VVKTKFGEMDTVTIEVNKPYKTHGWSLYQIGYDEKLGPASKLSIIEAVYDPWIKVIYIGIALMLAGAAYLFWQGRGVRSRE
jgi:cytochrome c biogenesis factor